MSKSVLFRKPACDKSQAGYVDARRKRRRVHRFTPREMQIARLIDEGYTYNEMGEKLGISPRTAKMYADRMRLALGVKKKREIPRMMRAMGLL